MDIVPSKSITMMTKELSAVLGDLNLNIMIRPSSRHYRVKVDLLHTNVDTVMMRSFGTCVLNERKNENAAGNK
jgi:hypothetical protein